MVTYLPCKRYEFELDQDYVDLKRKKPKDVKEGYRKVHAELLAMQNKKWGNMNRKLDSDGSF